MKKPNILFLYIVENTTVLELSSKFQGKFMHALDPTHSCLCQVNCTSHGFNLLYYALGLGGTGPPKRPFGPKKWTY